MMREKVKDLWRLCFDDTEEYIDMYFRWRYSDEVNIAIQSGDEVIAALQMLPYPMTYGGREIRTSYISGACTHPGYRNKGVMKELLMQSFAKMLQQEVEVSTLIPAEPWLFDYYARYGYAPVFRRTQAIFFASSEPFYERKYPLTSTQAFSEENYAYLNRKLLERPNCIQHTKNDFRFIMADLKADDGKLYTLLNDEKGIIALAVARPDNRGNRLIEEIVSDTSELETVLIQRIIEDTHRPELTVIRPPTPTTNEPLGMARIINAKAMLQLYAARHPELEMSLHITDGQLNANTGYYYLNKGECMNSAKRLPGSHLALTIGELADKVFSSLHPSMSLMLNM